jgi:SbsC C-terminal domain/Bacterial SH3 domain/Transglycosylase SLT domain
MKRGLGMKSVLRTAMLATVFSAVLWGGQSAEAATYSEAERLVKQAEGYAGTVKWDISYENTKKIGYPNMVAFNAAKNYRSKAATAINTLSSASHRTALNNRLTENVDLHVNRATAYIDSITAGGKIVNQQKNLNASIISGNLDQVEENYHSLSFEIRKQAIILYRVYGKSTREAILAKYKAPAESLRNDVAHEVTASMILDDIQKLNLPEGISSPDVPVKVNEYQSNAAYINYPTLKSALNNKYSATMNKIVLPQNKMKDLITEVAIEHGIPPEILKAIAYQETGKDLVFNHFTSKGEPIISFDNGIGIMQITNHSDANIEKLKYDTRYNIEIGAAHLKQRWDWTASILPRFNDRNPNMLEDWYFAILAYNGTGAVNHPNNSGNYQDKVYKIINKNSFSDESVVDFSDVVFEVGTFSNGLLDFTKKMQYASTTKTQTTQSFMEGKVLKTQINTNFRSAPNTDIPRIRELPAGTELLILNKGISDSNSGNHFVFYKVKVTSTGETGYVFSGAFAK